MEMRCENMVELLTYIAKNLVENPDDVSVTEVAREDGEFVYELRVAPGDMGKEIRAIMKSAAVNRGIKVSVDIVD